MATITISIEKYNEALLYLYQARKACSENVYVKNKIEKALKLIENDTSTQNSNS